MLQHILIRASDVSSYVWPLRVPLGLSTCPEGIGMLFKRSWGASQSPRRRRLLKSTALAPLHRGVVLSFCGPDDLETRGCTQFAAIIPMTTDIHAVHLSLRRSLAEMMI